MLRKTFFLAASLLLAELGFRLFGPSIEFVSTRFRVPDPELVPCLVLGRDPAWRATWSSELRRRGVGAWEASEPLRALELARGTRSAELFIPRGTYGEGLEALFEHARLEGIELTCVGVESARAAPCARAVAAATASSATSPAGTRG